MLRRETIELGPGVPNAELAEYRLTFAATYLLAAEKELESMITDDSNHTWAYVPAQGPKRWEYPACSQLAEFMDEGLIQHASLRPEDFGLAFIRLATEEPDSEYGGLHIDVDVGVGHQRDPEISAEDKEITRLLFNASHSAPRTVQLAETTRDLLQARGIEVSAEEYSALELPEDIPRRLIDIPPRTADSIFGLKFVSSQIPHQGLTDGSGHFLMAYGAYSEPIVAS